MLTRCPHCQTAFRVTTEQLKVRQGKVRCGSCQGVFDALDSLADEAPLVIAGMPAMVELPPEEVPVEPPEVEEITEPDVLPEPVVELEPEAPPIPSEPDEAPAAPAEAAAAPEEEAMPEAWAGVEEVAPPRRWPWVLGTLLLLLLGLGQALYIFRVEAAVLAPELRPALVAGCELLGCTLPRPRKPELVGIETSDLAPAGSDRLVLTALLKNRAPFEQEYPHLELTLTDRNDDTLLRKVLAPADYLPAAPSAGFAARDEAAVKLLLEAKGVAAVGYRLYLFYP
jgi:predicted Zn finger-like uncharacterized protein